MKKTKPSVWLERFRNSRKKHINKYWDEAFSAALASDAVVARSARLIFTREAQNLEIRKGTRVVPPPSLTVLQSEDLMDGVRFKPGGGGKGEDGRKTKARLPERT